ncbi:hypothetical protein FRC03_008409 [Tulasnella sp. 419]|nr:hypothetical protein FRC03_008409 [Tulasnella sp. 419]
MDSQRSKTAPKEPEPDHAAILAQIQALQAQLPPSLRSAITDGNPPAASSAPKRKSTPSNATAGRVIVGASPSPSVLMAGLNRVIAREAKTE